MSNELMNLIPKMEEQMQDCVLREEGCRDSDYVLATGTTAVGKGDECWAMDCRPDVEYAHLMPYHVAEALLRKLNRTQGFRDMKLGIIRGKKYYSKRIASYRETIDLIRKNAA